MFKDSDAEEEGNEEEEAERERKWRLERHEREKFIAEQEVTIRQAALSHFELKDMADSHDVWLQNSQNPAEEGDSQMLKLGKVVFKSAAMSKPKAGNYHNDCPCSVSFLPVCIPPHCAFTSLL